MRIKIQKPEVNKKIKCLMMSGILKSIIIKDNDFERSCPTWTIK
jgi:hypothetical protein